VSSANSLPKPVILSKGNVLFWLKRRKQRVVIKDAISSTGELKAGVPQWSVLGPLLFLITRLEFIYKFVNMQSDCKCVYKQFFLISC
jgi:hypothetical protein